MTDCPGKALTLREAVARCQTSCLTILYSLSFALLGLERNCGGESKLGLAGVFLALFCLRSDWLLGADAG